MDNQITINGVDYVPASQTLKTTDHVCVIADRGWIFEGYQSEDDPYMLTNANVVRKWTNGLGIGGIAKADHKDDYTLDEIGKIKINRRAVIAVIPLEW